jgi:Flp pilus assembly protein TadG
MNRLLSRFTREEDGAMIVFAVYVFLIILMVGGIGIDLMHFERNRAELQYTLDRAVLAAADLDQQLTPSEVVHDYFNKAGLSEYLTSVTVEEGLGYRVVSGTASADLDTRFMRMTGVNTLSAGAASTAEERIDGVEISLILDVSGSMKSNSRLTNLKVAARNFIDEMVDNTEDGKLSISIIPYATQVSVPGNFLDEFNVSQEHSYSNCVNFQTTDFNKTGISTTDPMQRAMHFDPWRNFDGRDNSPIELVQLPVCEAKASREMLILQKDPAVLKSFISNLTANGNTSIDVGMKWGTALLDPGLQPVVTDMISDGTVDAAFTGLPKAYNSSDTLKVIVLMTDGQNTSQYYLNEDFREGASDIWWNADEQEYSVYDMDRGQYFWPFNSTWNDHAYGNGGAVTFCARYRWNGTCRRWRTIPPEPGEAFAVDYPDLWARTTLQRNVRNNYEPWMNGNQAWNDWYYNVRNYVGSSTKDARTNSICETAKDQQIIVFTIAFEAPSRGKAVLKNCASSDGHFLIVEPGSNVAGISGAFAAIASSIRKLRLTQ